MKNRQKPGFILFSLLTLCIAFFYTFPVSAAGDLKQIQQAITNQNAQWSAAESWVTKLSPEERRKLCGTLLEKPDPAATSLLKLPQAPTLPAQFDWRDNNGNWVTPVKSQGGCGSCWDFSVIGQIESWWKIKHANVDSMLDLSEQFVLSCSDGGCDGWDPARALEFIKNTGVPTESCFRYRANDQIPCNDACANWEDEALKIPGWGYITLEEDIIDNIKNAILHHPVSGVYQVYADFMFYSGGVYEHVWGDLEGGHAIVIVGWDDTEESWICKNSWGKDWGENGYFRIKWGECGMGDLVPFVWDTITSDAALSASPNRFDFDLTYGDSVLQEITLTNHGENILEFVCIDFGAQSRFHPDPFNAWDGLSWWCANPEINGYADHWLQFLETPVLDLSHTTSPVLKWMGNWAIESPASADTPYDGWDGCNVWISIDGGKNFQVATPVSPEYNCQSLWSFGHPEQGFNMGIGIAGWGGSSNGWTPVEFDLADYRADSVIIRFAFASDMAECSTDDPNLTGLQIDNIVVSDADFVIFEDQANYPLSMKTDCRGYSPDAEWIQVRNGAGMILPGESIPVQLTLGTRDLTPGDYGGLIQIQYNNETQNPLQIPFSMRLKAPEHDLAVQEVWLPGDSLIVISSMELGAKIFNCGLQTETDFSVICTVQQENACIYSDTIFVPSLSAGQAGLVKFDAFIARQTGLFDFEVRIEGIPEDYNQFNDVTGSSCKVTNLVDGFETESGFWDSGEEWKITDKYRGRSGVRAMHINAETADNMNSSLIFKPGFALNLVDNAIMKFWTRYITEKNQDICYVEASPDSLNWVAMDSMTGNGPRWAQREINFSQFSRDEIPAIWVRFRFVTAEKNSKFGMLIDDIEIYPVNQTSISAPVEAQSQPETWHLAQNYPNPFNMRTQISYRLPDPGQTRITIYNTRGQIVRHLFQAPQTAGNHSIFWDGRDDSGKFIGTGVYFYNIKIAGKFNQTRKLVLLK